MARLDRFLISDSLIDRLPDLFTCILERRLSDHAPVFLTTGSVDYGPTVFRVFNSWFAVPEFHCLVKKVWADLDRDGVVCPFLFFKNALKVLKIRLKEWQGSVREGRQKEKVELLARATAIDVSIDDGLADPVLIQERRDVHKKLGDLESVEQLDVLQKTRINWVVEGDENTSFFHGMLNRRRKQLQIRGVLADGRWEVDPGVVKNVFHEFFKSKFSHGVSIPMHTRSDNFKRLDLEAGLRLDRTVSEDEVKHAVWDCGSDKAPGPDGFTFKFIKTFWDILKADICAFVVAFFDKGYIPVGCNASFITLIPKIENPLLVNDFRPISLIGVQYKIIAKLLANRLARELNSIISFEQSAFVAGRQILDGPLMVNEVASWAKKQKRKMMIFKVDFEKAYDSVSWAYLEKLMQFMGFSDKWRFWIRACLLSARSSVLINGNATPEFTLHRGLRQGDPLSPFLFIIVMEGLHVMMEDAVGNAVFRGVKIGPEDLHLSHLFYADDALFMGE